MRTYTDRARRAVLFGLGLFAGSVPAFAEENPGRPASASTTAHQPVLVAGAGGFALSSPDRDYELRIRGNIHADGRFHLSDSGDDTFLLRRVRPSFEGTFAKDFNFRIMPEFAGSSSSLVDAYVGYRFSPALNIQAGKFKVPFDLERLVSQTDLLFVERSYTTSLAPNRDNGLHMFGELLDGRLSYNLAWVDGTADGGTSITDNDSNKEVVGRLWAQPFQDGDSALRGLGFGVAVTQGKKSGGAPAGYRTNAQQGFFTWNSGVTATGSQTRIEPQASFYRGPFGVLGAWVASRQEITNGATIAEIENTGWFLAGSFVLTGEPASFRAVVPRHDFDPRANRWGAWEIAVRYAELDIDDAVFPAFANPATSATRVSSTTLGVNWYLNRNVKLVLNWEHAEFDGGIVGPVTAEDEDAILTRVQVRF